MKLPMCTFTESEICTKAQINVRVGRQTYILAACAHCSEHTHTIYILYVKKLNLMPSANFQTYAKSHKKHKKYSQMSFSEAHRALFSIQTP